MPNIVLKISKITISDTQFDKLEKSLPSNVRYEIEFHGRYTVFREFGTPPINRNMYNEMIVELTNAYVDKGVDEQRALEEAKKITQSLMLKGTRPQPFLRPAMAKYTYSLGKQDIAEPKDIEMTVRAIARQAEELFNQDSNKLYRDADYDASADMSSKNVVINIPLKYTIYSVKDKSRQEIE